MKAEGDGGVHSENRLLISGFIRDQERRGLQPRTIRLRRILLSCFLRWCDDRSPFALNAEEIELFLDGRRIGARTRHSWLANLHAFYEWAVLHELTTIDPTERIRRPRVRRGLPRPAATDQLFEALAHATPMIRCWIVLAAYQGLRCQEIAGLRREDVQDTAGLLRVVHGKGGYERVLPLHPAVLDALRLLPMPSSEWVFRRPQGGPWRPDQLSVRFAGALRDLGVDATGHQLRHWFGTALYRDTHDLLLVQEMLGHASPATTAIYAAFDNRKARGAVNALLIAPLDAA